MRLTLAALAASLPILAIAAGPRAPSPQPGVDWPSFRGPNASGSAEGFPTPLRWDAGTRASVLWKTPVPGLGHSSPVVWRDLACVTTADGAGVDSSLRVGLYGDIRPVDDAASHSWKVVCLDKKTGAVRWQRTAREGVPRIKRHMKSTHANPSLATDGRHLIAFFGSEGLYAFDLAGRPLWQKDLGVLDSGFFIAPEAQWGFGSSPVIHDGRVIVQADVLKGSFLASFDVATGRELWRTPRADVPTWSTPTVAVSDGRAQVIVNGFRHIGGYDLSTGRELWRMKGGGDIPVPTPVVGHGLVFITSAHGGPPPVFAVRLGATGDVSLGPAESANKHVAWSALRDGAYMQTPLVYGDHLYVCRDNGVLRVFEARTGRRLYEQRLGDGQTGFTASPVAADGKVYFTSEEGDVYVVKAGPAFELLAKNPLGEVTLATPAISEGLLLFRTRGHVVAVGPAR